MSDVLDLMPRLALKAKSACKHQLGCSVDPVAASLTCDECGIELDPWTYLRWLAGDTVDLERRREALVASLEALIAEGNGKIALLNQRIVALNEECQRLVEHKSRLYNDVGPDGRLIGTSLNRPRSRPSKRMVKR